MRCLALPCVFFVLWSVVVSRSSFMDQIEWSSWKEQYNRHYANEELENFHRQIWQRNKAFVEDHNSKVDAKFQLGLNQFADQEVPQRPKLFYEESTESIEKPSRKFLFHPSSWDWRDKGAVTPVRDQGMMGDAQAVVAGECVESFHFIHSKLLLRLSEFEVHDCCSPPFNPLLNTHIFDCIHNISGLCSYIAYPTSEGKCLNNSCKAVAQVDGGQRVPYGDENMLLEAVLKTPVFAAIDAGQRSFMLYTGGIYSDDNCSSKQLDHVVQIVGYGTANGTDYWIVRNSWGVAWGMQGYILMARNMKNMCGISSMALYPD